MPAAGHMNFFAVEKCGLYKVNNDTPFGCEIEETFDLIMNWVGSRSLAETTPWDPETRGSKSKCYCRGIYKDNATGDFVVVLWKSDTDSNGTLMGAIEDSSLGDEKIVEYTNNYKGQKVIWGRPCYYWIIPSLQTVVSIKFEHSVCDTQLFQEWVIACINNRVQHPNKSKETTERGFVRLSYIDGREDNPYRYAYRFDLHLRSLNTSKAELSELSSKVTHIIRRETILVKANNEREDWVNKLNNLIPFVSAAPKSKKRQIEITAEARPTPLELKSIIETHAKENRSDGAWDNVGFRKSDGRVAWVDKYRLKETIYVSNYNSGIFSAESLFKHLSSNRDKYLSSIRMELNGDKAKNTVEVVA